MTRLFTAERQRQSVQDTGTAGDEMAKVMTLLAGLESRLGLPPADDGALPTSDPDAQSAPAQAPPSAVPVVTDERVARTLAEIAILRRKGDDDRDQLTTAARELDEVVRSTEEATFVILSSAEAVDQMLDDLMSLCAGNPVLAELVSQAQIRLAEIYQASGFQDLTGQRIGKVVRTLRFLDERIAQLEAIWVGSQTEMPIPIEVEATSDESRLLNGPQMNGDALSQDDIDAMFD